MIKAWQNFIQAAIDLQNKNNNVPWPLGLRGKLDGIVDLKDYGVISVSGDDATSFLQGQLTCDVNIDNNKELLFGSYCNLKGRVIAFFRILFWENSYYLILPKDIIAPTITELKKYTLIANVNVENISDKIILVGIIGDDALHKMVDIYENIFTTKIKDHSTRSKIIEYLDNHIADKKIFILNQKTSPKSGIALIKTNNNDNKEHFESFLNKVLSININLLSTNEWNLININNKIPEIFANSIDKFLPHNIGLPSLGAVSFKKGCYKGQEIISRMEYKATIKKQLEIVKLDIEASKNINHNDSEIVLNNAIDNNNMVFLVEKTKTLSINNNLD